MAEFYDLCEKEYKAFDPTIKPLYSEDILREVCLGLNSMSVGAESKYFNGYTNINDFIHEQSASRQGQYGGVD